MRTRIKSINSGPGGYISDFNTPILLLYFIIVTYVTLHGLYDVSNKDLISHILTLLKDKSKPRYLEGVYFKANQQHTTKFIKEEPMHSYRLHQSASPA